MGIALLPFDVLSPLFSFLHSAAIRHFATCSPGVASALERTPSDRLRACLLVRWYIFGGGAHVDERDLAVAIGDGQWCPGGVAVADLSVHATSDIAFRFIIDRR